MKMDQLNTIHHFVLFYYIESLKQFARCETELADVSSRFFPFAASDTCKLDPNAEIGLDL